jgi:hypothetical protein
MSLFGLFHKEPVREPGMLRQAYRNVKLAVRGHTMSQEQIVAREIEANPHKPHVIVEGSGMNYVYEHKMGLPTGSLNEDRSHEFAMKEGCNVWPELTEYVSFSEGKAWQTYQAHWLTYESIGVALKRLDDFEIIQKDRQWIDERTGEVLSFVYTLRNIKHDLVYRVYRKHFSNGMDGWESQYMHPTENKWTDLGSMAKARKIWKTDWPFPGKPRYSLVNAPYDLPVIALILDGHKVHIVGGKTDVAQRTILHVRDN